MACHLLNTNQNLRNKIQWNAIGIKMKKNSFHENASGHVIFEMEAF